MKKRPPINPYLTTRTRNLLIRIRDSEDGEIVFNEGGGWWVDDHQVNGQNAMDLIRLCLLRADSFNRDDYQIYELYEESRKIIDDIKYVPLVVKELRKIHKTRKSK